MKKLYDQKGILFAVGWIMLYCFVTIPIRGEVGDESVLMLVSLLAIAAGALGFICRYGLAQEYGLTGWTKNARRLLYMIPMWILVTGNLWGGIRPVYAGLDQVCAVLSMLLIGVVEELLFRGFLFRALLKKDGAAAAVIISAVTFGIGHIVNLLAGQASLKTVVQVLFAIGWGFILTLVYYKGGSLLPCILAHGLVDAFSKFGQDDMRTAWAYMAATIVTAAAYSAYLIRLPDETSR